MGYSSNLLPDVPAFLPPVGSSQGHGLSDATEPHLGLSPEQQQKLHVSLPRKDCLEMDTDRACSRTSSLVFSGCRATAHADAASGAAQLHILGRAQPGLHLSTALPAVGPYGMQPAHTRC